MLAAIEALPLADALRRSVWAYPVLEIVHIAGFAALVGSLLMLELRVLGTRAELALAPLARLVLRIALAGFCVAAAAGVAMFVSSATELGNSPVFLAKMSLIVAAGINAAVFHARGSLHLHDTVARLQAGTSLLLWFGVIACGRLIAYL